MELSHGLIIITAVHLLAAASPGPDFVMVTQQSLSHGRRAGILCSFGISLGLSVHIIYSSLGLAAVIANSINLITMIRILGGSYLVYLGIKGLTTKNQIISLSTTHKDQSLTPLKIITKGFLCNVLNPKASVYFVSLFTLILSDNLPVTHLAIYGIWIMCIQMAWFSFLASILSIKKVSTLFRKFGHWIDRLLGGAMLALGIKVLTTRTS